MAKFLIQHDLGLGRVLKAHDQLFAAVIHAMSAVLQAALDGAGTHRARAAVAYSATVPKAAIAHAILGLQGAPGFRIPLVGHTLQSRQVVVPGGDVGRTFRTDFPAIGDHWLVQTGLLCDLERFLPVLCDDDVC